METAACCGTHPPRSANLQDAQDVAEMLIDALLDTTDPTEWLETLDMVTWATRAGNAALVGNALRTEARERLAHITETAGPSGAREG